VADEAKRKKKVGAIWSNPEPLDKRISLPQDIEIICLGGLEKM